MTFANLGLSAELVRAVTDQGYLAPTPIQTQAIPVVLSGRDLLGAAQTGTGKTAGFTLPMLQRFSARASASTSPARHPIRALILVPTRELAAQVQESVRTYGKYLELRSCVIFGGVGFNPQVEELRRGVDILVATPGRLLDHVEQRTVDLRQVEILVLDEADRMLDMGFIPAVRRILALLPANRQNLLFSATFPDEIRQLAASFMHEPVTVEVAPRNRPVELITQAAYPVERERKRQLLAHLVKTNNWRQVLVFTRTKHGANRLAHQLTRDGIDADAIHGNKSQGARTRALKRFKDNELQVLVATDIAARGLDIEELPHVVNYDLPHVAEDYVHRIGRTGRAGAAGEAVSLVSADDRPLLAAIERLTGRRIEQKTVAGFEAASQAAAPRREEQTRNNQQPRHERGSRDHAHATHEERQQRHGRNGRGRPDGKRRGQQHGQHGQREQPEARASGQGRNHGQHHHRGQPRPQQRHDANGKGRREERQADRQVPRVAAYGQYQPQAQHRLPDPPQPQGQRRAEDDERQPTPEKAKNQLFPAFFGLFSRKR